MADLFFDKNYRWPETVPIPSEVRGFLKYHNIP